MHMLNQIPALRSLVLTHQILNKKEMKCKTINKSNNMMKNNLIQLIGILIISVREL